MIVLKTVDAHAGGSPLRLVVDGWPSAEGLRIADKLSWSRTHLDHLRRLVMNEPRGHEGMCGAVMVESPLPDAHAGLLFMDADGFNACSFEGALAVAALSERYGLIVTDRPGPVLFDTAAGLMRVRKSTSLPREAGTTWSIEGPPAFVTHGGVTSLVAARPLRADIAWAGAFYAIVDSESAGVPVDGTRYPELRRAATAVAADIGMRYRLSHPDGVGDDGVSAVIFTGPAHGRGAEFRAVTVTAAGRIVRGVSGGGLAAIMTVLHAMGLPVEHEGLALEGSSGTGMTGRIAGTTTVGDYTAIIPEVEIAVWPTGEHTFLLDEADPLREGFLME